MMADGAISTAFERAALNVIDRRDQYIAAVEEATWSLARAIIGEAVLPCGRAVRADEMLRYLRQRMEVTNGM